MAEYRFMNRFGLLVSICGAGVTEVLLDLDLGGGIGAGIVGSLMR